MLDNVITQPFIQALGWTLLHFLWQGTVLALLLATLNYILKRASANVRYSIASATLLLMVLLPAVTFWHSFTSASTSLTSTISETKINTNILHISSKTGAQQMVVTSMSTNWFMQLTTTLPWLVTGWLIGVICLSLRFLGGWIVAERIKRRYAIPASALLQQTVNKLAKRLDISRTVRVCNSIAAEMPVVIGWLKPMILLPAGALTGLNTQQIEAIIAHELAHIRRHDYLVNILQNVIETVLFYHPAVWWVSNQMRIERENCCDDIAVKVCGDPIAYARALTELEQLRCSTPQLAMAVNGGSLLKRVQRLLNPSMQRSSPAMVGVIALMAVAIICVAAQTAFSSNSNPKPATSKSTAVVVIQANELDHEDDEDDEDDDNDIDNDVDDNDVDQDQDNDDVDKDDDDNDVDDDRDSDIDDDDVDDVDNDHDQDDQDNDDNDLANKQIALVSLTQDNQSNYIDELTKLGYNKLSVDQMVALKVHGVSPQFIREIKSLGYENITIDELVSFKIHSVSPQFITQNNSKNSTRLSPQTLIAMKIHGVSPEFTQEMRALGFNNLSNETLIAMKIHGVSAKYAQEIKALGYNIDAERLIAFRIHSVSPQFINQFTALGYKLDMDDVVGFRIHGVTPEFVKEMGTLGFTKISQEDLLALKIHRVTSEYVRSIKETGYNNFTVEEILALRIHAVSPAFIKEAKARGFGNLTIEEMVRLKNTGIIKVK